MSTYVLNSTRGATVVLDFVLNRQSCVINSARIENSYVRYDIDMRHLYPSRYQVENNCYQYRLVLRANGSARHPFCNHGSQFARTRLGTCSSMLCPLPPIRNDNTAQRAVFVLVSRKPGYVAMLYVLLAIGTQLNEVCMSHSP